MVKLEELSKIGIGTYRMNVENASHQESLQYALDHGINLIDTASNYAHSKSEKLIGEIVGAKNRTKAFITTKAGYVQSVNMELLKNIPQKVDYVQINDNFCYCIDPRYLEAQVNESLRRLQTDYIDCFLLHNPEYYCRIYSDKEKLYQVFASALSFLESLKKKGVIRYFGISSNKLPQPHKSNGINLTYLNPTQYDGFKFIQFPYNLAELDASDKNYNDKSLIQLAKEMNLKLLSNRPFNSRIGTKFIRLTDFDKTIDLDELERQDEGYFKNLIELLKNRIAEIDDKEDIYSFDPILSLRDYRKKLERNESVARLYYGQVLPLINHIYENDVPPKVQKAFNELKACSLQYTYLFMQQRTSKFKKQLYEQALIPSLDNSLTQQACQKYLNDGIDHVLVGLRSKKYIDDILPVL